MSSFVRCRWPIAVLVTATVVGLACDGREELHRAEVRVRTVVPEDPKDPRAILDRPGAIQCLAGRHLAVLDVGGSRVVVFDRNGNYVRQIGRKGRGPGELLNPVDMAVGPGGNVYVLDGGNRRLSVFDSAGVFRSSFRVPARYLGPNTRIAVGPDRMIYAHFPEFDSLFTVFSPEGEVVGRFGGLRPYEYPVESVYVRMLFNSVAFGFDSRGYLYVLFLNLPYLRIYDRNHGLRLEKRIETPDMEVVRESYKRNLNAQGQPAEGTVILPGYFWDMAVCPSGHVIAAIGGPGVKAYYLMSPGGRILAKLTPQPGTEAPYVKRLCCCQTDVYVSNDVTYGISAFGLPGELLRVRSRPSL